MFKSISKIVQGYLYIGYPIIGTAEGPYPIDAMYLSPQKGLVIFNLIENKDIESYEKKQDDSYNKLEAKLKGFSTLMDRRKLCVEISVITFAPVYNNNTMDPDYPICNEENLQQVLEEITWENSEYFEKLVAVLQAISTIRKGEESVKL